MPFSFAAQAAESQGVPVFKYKQWQVKKVPVPEVLRQYRSLGVDLNVLPFCSQFIPSEVINLPKHKTIIYHPSLLPRHRGASSINWSVVCAYTLAELLFLNESSDDFVN